MNISGCNECQSGLPTKEGSILRHQCLSRGFSKAVTSDIICRNGLWTPGVPACQSSYKFHESKENPNIIDEMNFYRASNFRNFQISEIQIVGANFNSTEHNSTYSLPLLFYDNILRISQNVSQTPFLQNSLLSQILQLLRVV